MAEALSLSVGTVHNIAREPVEDLGPVAAEIRRRFAAKYLLLADHILNRIGDLSIRTASLKDKAIAAAILTDKALLLEKRKGEHLPPATPPNDMRKGEHLPPATPPNDMRKGEHLPPAIPPNDMRKGEHLPPAIPPSIRHEKEGDDSK